MKSLAQLELLSDCLVTVYVGGVEVIQQPAPLANHHEQATAGTMILLVLLKVLGQVVDALSQQRNLHIGRTGVPFMQLNTFNRFRFRFHTFLSIQSILHYKCLTIVLFLGETVKHLNKILASPALDRLGWLGSYPGRRSSLASCCGKERDDRAFEIAHIAKKKMISFERVHVAASAKAPSAE